MEFAFMRPENISGMMTPDPAAIVARGQEFLFCPVNAGRLMSFLRGVFTAYPRRDIDLGAKSDEKRTTE
jgi:hypothetical protein